MGERVRRGAVLACVLACALACALAFVLALPLAGCRCLLADFPLTPCDTAADCPSVAVCQDGYCVPPIDGGAGGDGAPGDGGDGAPGDGGDGGGGADASDAALGDLDGDTIPDAADNCPLDANTLQEDVLDPSGVPDGVGDACDDSDADLFVDAADCAPGDGAIHAGAVDLCDGADADCAPGVCSVDLAGATPRFADGNGLAFVLTVAAPGAFRSLDSTSGADWFASVALAAPSGVAVNPVISPARAYVAAGASGTLLDRRTDTGADPTGAEDLDLPTAVTGPMRIVTTGTTPSTIALMPRSDLPGLQYFSPGTFEGDVTTEGSPVLVDLRGSPLLLMMSERVDSVAGRYASGLQAWVTLGVSGEIAQVNLTIAGGLVVSETGLLSPQPSQHARGALFAAGDVLVLGAYELETSLGVIATYVIASPSTAANTAFTGEAPMPSATGTACPRGLALGLDGTTLYIADWCNARVVTGSVDGVSNTVGFGSSTSTAVCEGPYEVAVASNGAGGENVLVLCDGGPAGGAAAAWIIGLD